MSDMVDSNQTDPNIGKWKLKDPHVCRVFFSSPFNGMEKEREALTSLYWPQIQSKCNAQGNDQAPESTQAYIFIKLVILAYILKVKHTTERILTCIYVTVNCGNQSLPVNTTISN